MERISLPVDSIYEHYAVYGILFGCLAGTLILMRSEYKKSNKARKAIGNKLDSGSRSRLKPYLTISGSVNTVILMGIAMIFVIGIPYSFINPGFHSIFIKNDHIIFERYIGSDVIIKKSIIKEIQLIKEYKAAHWRIEISAYGSKLFVSLPTGNLDECVEMEEAHKRLLALVN